MKKQNGALLIMMAVFAAVLIGLAGLVIDVGRIVIFRAELQNAVDSAALAAAKELDLKADSMDRAMAAEQAALTYGSTFSRKKDLLNTTTLPDDTAFTFFCVIGSTDDVDVSDADARDYYCGDVDEVEPGKWETEDPTHAHYVRVDLRAASDAADNVLDYFTVDLIFFPVIKALGLQNVLTKAVLGATALAGRNFYICNAPPLAICDPFEGEGGFYSKTTEGGGDGIGIIKLVSQGGGGAWAPGDYGFLQLTGTGSGNLAQALAEGSEAGCQPATLTTDTGLSSGKARSGLNTRFGIYDTNEPTYNQDNAPPYEDKGTVDPLFRFNADNTSPYAYSASPGAGDPPTIYPPPPNLRSYPADDTEYYPGTNDRIGKGSWDCSGYYGRSDPDTCGPSTLSRRWDIYNLELLVGGPVPLRHSLSYSNDPNRRVVYIAVVSCGYQDIHGTTTATLEPPDGFAKVFLVQPATPTPNFAVYGEYIGWADESDDNIHVEVKLYE